MMHHFYPPRMKERERKREKELWWTKTKKVKGREEARLYRLGRHIEEPWEEGPHPFAGSRLFMLRNSCGSTASQPASPPLPPRKRAETDGREGGKREEWEEEVSHENRLRIKRLKVIWYLYRGNVAKFDKDRKDGEESFFFPFSCFDYGDERGNNKSRYRILVDVIVKCSERTLFPVYFYMLLFLCEDEN